MLVALRNSVLIQPLMLLLSLAFLIIWHSYEEHQMIRYHYFLLLSSIGLIFLTNRASKLWLLTVVEIYHLILFMALLISYLFLNVAGLPSYEQPVFWFPMSLFVLFGAFVSVLKLLKLIKKLKS